MNTSEVPVQLGGVEFLVLGTFHDIEDFELEDVQHKGESVIELLESKVVKTLEDRAFEKLLASHLEDADNAKADKQESARDMRKYG